MVQIVAIAVVGTPCAVEAFFRQLQRTHPFIRLYTQPSTVYSEDRCEEQTLLFSEPVRDEELEEIAWHHDSPVQVAVCACAEHA